jgi:hypothetical protein
MHTLTGTAADFAELAVVATARGFRVAVCLRRGHLGVPLRTPRFNLLGNVDDMDVHVGGVGTFHSTLFCCHKHGSMDDSQHIPCN